MSAQALTLDEALMIAEGRAPEVTASRVSASAAQSLSVAAGALPDPKLSIGVDEYPLQGDNRYQLNRSKRVISLMQDVPNGDKREAARQLAEATVSSSRMQSRFAQLNVRREAALAWLSMYYLARKADVLTEQENENHLKQASSKARLATGAAEGLASEALVVQLEQARLADARDDLTRDVSRARAQLARWVGADKAAEPVMGTLPSWLEQTQNVDALDEQPDLRSSAMQIDAARAELAMARADKIPDWSVEFGVERDGMGESMAMLKFNFSLPLFSSSRQDPKVAAAAAAIERSEAEHMARRANYRQQFEELVAERDALSSQLERLAKTVFPLLDKQVELALAAFRSGKGNANSMIEMRDARLASRLRELDLQSQWANAQTRLYFLTGGL